MEKAKSSKALQIISGILLIMAGSVSFLYMLVSDFKYFIDALCGDDTMSWSYLLNYLYDICFIVAGVFIIVKKNFIPVTICFGTLSLLLLYWIIDSFPLDNYFYSFTSKILFIRDINMFVEFSILTVFSAVALAKPRCKFLKVGFIPGIFAVLEWFLYIAFRISIIVEEQVYGIFDWNFETVLNLIVYVFYFALIAAGLFLYGLALGRFPEAEKESAPEEDEAIFTYIAPATSVTTPVYCEKDVAAELRKYKSMLDEGLINQEDYDNKKARLLEN